MRGHTPVRTDDFDARNGPPKIKGPQSVDAPPIDLGKTSVDPGPPLRTNALIADAFERAIQTIDIASHIRIRAIQVKPDYSIGDDRKLLAADVFVKVSLIFPTGDPQ